MERTQNYHTKVIDSERPFRFNFARCCVVRETRPNSFAIRNFILQA